MLELECCWNLLELKVLSHVFVSNLVLHFIFIIYTQKNFHQKFISGSGKKFTGRFDPSIFTFLHLLIFKNNKIRTAYIFIIFTDL